MTGVRNSLTFTQSDALADIASGQSCHIVLETSPPDYVEKISRYLEANEGHSRQNEVTLSREPAEADSDSGDSLFITQRAVPEPVRSGRRRRHYSLRSHLTSPGDLTESNEDSSSSASLEESKTGKERRRKKYTLPKYRFPLLAEKKSRSNLLPSQNRRLHNYVMGGFFKCVRGLWQSYQRAEDLQSSLPTVDIDGEDISSLSEEDEGKAEDEDIKVVERKRFMAPSKAKQTWGSQSNQQRKRRKASNARKVTLGEGQTKTLSKKTVKAALLKDVPLLSDTDSSDNREPSNRGLVQRARSNEHATTDRSSLAQSEILKAKKRLTFQQKAAQEELCDDSDATVCELPRSPKQSTQKGGEASTPVAEPQADVLHTDDMHTTGQAGDGPEGEHCEKKRKKNKRDKGDNEGVEEGKSQSLEEPEGLHAATCVNSSHSDNTPRQDEGDTPDPKHKKKERKKNKPAAENVEQEEDGNLESDVRADDGGKKKKKRNRSGEDVEQLQSGTVAEPLNDEVKKKKKKKRKKEEEFAITEEHEEEEALNRTSDLQLIPTEQLEEPGNCLESAAASSQETFSHVKKKKHKKKRHSSSNGATQDGEEGVDVNISIDESVTSAKASGMSLKMKKAIFENICDSPEQKEKVENIGDTQKTEGGIEDQNTELVTKKKKKKKKSEICSRGISENGVAQSADSVSVQEKEKRRTSSFLVADAKENDAQTYGGQNFPSQSLVSGTEKHGVSPGCSEELNGIVKKKRKRKVSVAQDTMEKPHFEEANETYQSFLPESTDTGVKRKKKRTTNGSQSVTPVKRSESAAGAGLSPPNEAVVLKKKKKKKFKDHLIQQDSPAATDNAEPVTSSLNKTKGKRGPSAEMSLDSTMAENLALNDVTHKKKKKKKKPTDDVLLEVKSLTEPAELEPREKKKKERNKPSAVPSSPVSSEASLSKVEMSSPDNNTKNKHRKVKRRLYDPSEDLLTD